MRSNRRLGALAAIMACAVVGSGQSFAQNAVPSGDPHRGKDRANTCLGCHGVPDYKNAYPNYRVPKLEGQHPEYLVSALQAYRAGDRSHITMHSQASSLSDQDMADIAAYFAGMPIKSGGAPEGKAPAAAQVCVACHGAD